MASKPNTPPSAPTAAATTSTSATTSSTSRRTAAAARATPPSSPWRTSRGSSLRLAPWNASLPPPPGRHAPVARGGISFCLDCAAGFTSALCDRHGGHETVRIVLRDGRHCVRCTASEPWFEAFDGVMTYKDDSGGVLVPLHPRWYSSRTFACCGCRRR